MVADFHLNMDGQLVAASLIGLTDGRLSNTIRFDENEILRPSFAWTGTGDDGLAVGGNCSGWEDDFEREMT